MAVSQLATGTPSAGTIVPEPQIAIVTELPAQTQEMIVPELIVEQAAAYGVDSELALKIARCESNLQQFDPKTGKLIRGRENKADVGVFQINEYYHLGKSQALGFDIETAEGNIEYAMWLINDDGAGPWIWSKPCWNK